MRILLVEDDRIARLSLVDALKREGYEVEAAVDATEGVAAARRGGFDVVVTDLRLPGGSGIEVLRAAKAANPSVDVLVVTAFGTVDTAVEALKLGAYDYVTKPLSPDKFLSMLRNIGQYRRVLVENAQLRRRLELSENRAVVGESPAMTQLLQTLESVAQHTYTVLIQGESGTGKEIVARRLHHLSERRDRPFIAINCAAIPESLLESELFGHEKGSFSGAVARHRGHFERADQGTIFIDDIDDLPLAPQVKLLRVLQERRFHRVGGTEEVHVDVRVICATKVDLLEQVRRGNFREDLFYRLNIVPLNLPPLRDRREDLPLLTAHFFEKHGAQDLAARLDPHFFQDLEGHAWPGNVRELENLVQRMIATGEPRIPPGFASGSAGGQTPVSTPKLGPPPLATHDLGHRPQQQEGADAPAYPPFEVFMREREEEIILWALTRSDHNVSQAARLLDLPRGTLRSRIEKLGIDLLSPIRE